jgi:hypothetical protein
VKLDQPAMKKIADQQLVRMAREADKSRRRFQAVHSRAIKKGQAEAAKLSAAILGREHRIPAEQWLEFGNGLETYRIPMMLYVLNKAEDERFIAYLDQGALFWYLHEPGRRITSWADFCAAHQMRKSRGIYTYEI